MGTAPVLWHIAISHYSEKARWALDFKGVDHVRRTPLPGAHMLVALGLTRGEQHTLPILQLDGATIADSTAIVAELERRFPEPALYPEDEADRRRALELEEYFDEQLGAYARRLVWHEVTNDRARIEQLAPKLLPVAPPVAARVVTAFVNLRYGAGAEAAAEGARRKVVAAFDRLEAELGDRRHLVGERFSVADLTAAALFYPIVLPPDAPRVLDEAPAALERFREPLKERPGYRWVEEIYSAHRAPHGAAARDVSTA